MRLVAALLVACFLLPLAYATTTRTETHAYGPTSPTMDCRAYQDNGAPTLGPNQECFDVVAGDRSVSLNVQDAVSAHVYFLWTLEGPTHSAVATGFACDAVTVAIPQLANVQDVSVTLSVQGTSPPFQGSTPCPGTTGAVLGNVTATFTSA